MAYGEKVLDHYENPRNVGSFDNTDNVGTGMVGAPACGAAVHVRVGGGAAALGHVELNPIRAAARRHLALCQPGPVPQLEENRREPEPTQ